MPTLSTNRLLQAILASYKVKVPFLASMATDFSADPVRLHETVTAHVRVLPNLSTYDSTTGYANGANSARSLLADVPITVDNHSFVPILWEHLNNIADQKDNFLGAAEDAAYVLARGMADSILAKFRGSNVSRERIKASASVDLVELEAINGVMNEAGASPIGRIGIVNTAVATALATDTKVASRDFYGVLTGGSSYRMFRNVAGFEAIYEYPTLNANNNAELAATVVTATNVFTATGHTYRNGDRVRFTTTTTLPAGLELDTTYFIRDAADNTFKVAATDGGDAINITNTGTGTHNVVGWENLSGVFFERSGIAVRAGTVGKTDELAGTLGIPRTMSFESMIDPNNGFPMSLAKWQQAGKGDLFVAPISIWGSSVGRQAGDASAITDNGTFRLVSA